jgi:hypothetical protein
MYQSIATTIVRGLCANEDVATHPDMLEAIPAIVDVVIDGAYAEKDTDLIVIQDAYECLILLASHDPSAQSLVDCGSVDKLVAIIVEERFNHEQAIIVLMRLVNVLGSDVWRKNFLVYLSLVERLSNDFEKERSKGKAQACEVMTQLLFAAPKNMVPLRGSTWVMNLQKGVADILGSRVNKELRDAALHLSAAITMSVDPRFWLRCASAAEQSSARDRFLVLLVRLVVVELHLILEDTTWQEVVAEKELLASCLAILENVMTAYFSGKLQLLGEENRTFLYQDASEGADVVLGFIETFLKERVESEAPAHLNNDEEVVFTASMRILTARLMEDPDVFGERASQFLPHVCTLMKGTCSANSPLWDILLPAFVVFSEEDKCRKVIVDAEIPILVFEKFDVLRDSFLTKIKMTHNHHLAAETRQDVNSLKLVLNLLLNVSVSERDALRQNGRGYSQYWRPVFEMLLEIGSLPEYLPLVGHLVVVGLMLTRIFPEFQESMGGVGCRYLSAAVRFLWDAFNLEEKSDGQTLDVSFGYKPIWEEVKDLWYIGMDCVTKLADKTPNIADFFVLVDWPAEIMRCLAKSNPVLPHTAMVFETFLLTLAKRSKAAETIMKEFGPHKFCDPHGMTALKNYLVPFSPPIPTP